MGGNNSVMLLTPFCMRSRTNSLARPTRAYIRPKDIAAGVVGAAADHQSHSIVIEHAHAVQWNRIKANSVGRVDRWNGMRLMLRPNWAFLCIKSTCQLMDDVTTLLNERRQRKRKRKNENPTVWIKLFDLRDDSYGWVATGCLQVHLNDGEAFLAIDMNAIVLVAQVGSLHAMWNFTKASSDLITHACIRPTHAKRKAI